jgi:TatD DNase family protein
MAIDTHAHLFWPDFDSDRDLVVQRAARAGIEAILNLGTSVETSRECINLAEAHDSCWAAVGVHPNQIEEWAKDPASSRRALMELAAHPRVCAIGESGLDYFRSRATRSLQLSALEQHAEMARETGLPLVLHNRMADDDLRSALEAWDRGVTVILHCFTGDEALGRWAIDRGHYLGLGGVFTYPSSELPRLVGSWDPDRLLLETDSPFLAPAPHRGQRNEPAYLLHTARAVAEALSWSLQEVTERTTRNARRVLRLPA